MASVRVQSQILEIFLSGPVPVQAPISNRLQSLAAPLLSSEALKRLEGISFLGILSPRYANISNSPIFKRRSLRNARVQEDGSRAEHSIGVAEIAVEICSRLNLSAEHQKYAAAWGLLHDLGNWPLSHTGQHAFSELLGVKTKTIREWMISNDARAPQQYFVGDALLDCNIDPERLLMLFRKAPDKELQPVSDLFRSKLTPDMLEGVWRSGRAFGITRFLPSDIYKAWYMDLAREVVVSPENFGDAIVFWKAKQELYSRFFSSKSAIRFESIWSQSIFNFFQEANLTLRESLELDECELVENIAQNINHEIGRVHRWKPPVRQMPVQKRIRRYYTKPLTLQSLNLFFLEESQKLTPMMNVNEIQNLVSPAAYEIFSRAWHTSEKLLNLARPIVASSLKESSLDLSKVCIATVGSTARREAMHASDIDLLPIWCGEPSEFPHFEDLTGKVREDLRQKAGLDVSTSRNLMRSTQLSTLRKADGIGGDEDQRRTLTQRMLILTESEQLGGGYSISKVRRQILEAYVGERDIERTVSKHPLNVCNDIARYYRTLCVDYKSRAETKPESWAERHAKLRNARKIWYFSTVMALAKDFAGTPLNSYKVLFGKMENTFSLPPILRLSFATDDDNKEHSSKILEVFSKYLDAMGDREFRDNLNMVGFDARNEETFSDGRENPYFEMHVRSRELSNHMIEMLLATSHDARRKVYEWFFL